jgi:hypothetical protein
MSFGVLRIRNVLRRTVPPLVTLLFAAAATLFATIATAQVSPPKPTPDVIVFTNDDQLTGQLERGVNNSIVFKSDVAGEITVSLDKVKSLTASGSFAVLGKYGLISPGAVMQGTVQFSDKTLSTTTPNGAVETLPQEKIAYIIDQPTYNREMAKLPGPLYAWNGSVHGGATVVRSTDNGTTYTTGLSVVRAIPAVPFLPARNRTSFDLQETYGKLTSPVIPQTTPPSPPSIALTSIFHTHAERDEYFSPQFFALAQIGFDHNYAQGLNLQETFGSGIGWTTLKSASQQMDVKADLHYEKQTFQTASSDQNLVGSTLSEAYHRNLPRKLVFTQSASVLPAWNNSSAYSANAMVGLVMPVFKRLGLTVTSTDNFLNDPSAGYKKNSFQFVTAASYSLK